MHRPTNGDVLQTHGPDGEVRHWSVCRGCGHIDALGTAHLTHWYQQPYCDACQDEAIAQAEWEAAAAGCADADLL